MTEFRHMPIAELDVRDDESRNIDMQHVIELAESIKKHGIRTAISVQRRGEHFYIIDGVHRVCAAITVGLTDIPCIILDIDDEEVRRICTISSSMRSLL